MSKQLLDAVRSGDIIKVKKLLDEGADINYLGDHSPLGIALIEFDSIEMPNFLIQYKNKDGVKPINLEKPATDFNGFTPLHLLCNYYSNGPKKVNKQVLALLLAAGANITAKTQSSYSILSDVKKNNDPIVAEMFLYEAFLRPNYGVIKELLPKNSKLSAAKLKEYLELAPRKITEFQLDLITKNIDALTREKLIPANVAEEFKQILADPILSLLNTQELPKCLQEFEKKQKEKPSLPSIIANLQYHRGRLAEPGTNEQLLCFNEGKMQGETISESNERLAARKQGYDLCHLLEFINANLYDRQKAVIEMCQHQGVFECICQAALHPDLPQQERNRCIALLSYFEKLESHDRLVIYSQKLGLSALEATMAELLTQTANKITDTVNSEIAKLRGDLNRQRMDNQRLSQQVSSLEAALNKILYALDANPGKDSFLDYQTRAKRPY